MKAKKLTPPINYLSFEEFLQLPEEMQEDASRTGGLSPQALRKKFKLVFTGKPDSAFFSPIATAKGAAR